MRDRFDRARQTVVYYWPIYGPKLVGAFLILIILLVGVSLFKNRNRNPELPTVQNNNLDLQVGVSPTPIEKFEQPSSVITLGGGTNDTSSQNTSTTSATTKGDLKKLPETGFESLLLIPFFALSFFFGLKLVAKSL